MGCNVEKAKLEIYEILVKDQKKSDKKTVENIEKLAEDISSKLDSDIKSNFIMSKNKNIKEKRTRKDKTTIFIFLFFLKKHKKFCKIFKIALDTRIYIILVFCLYSETITSISFAI